MIRAAELVTLCSDGVLHMEHVLALYALHCMHCMLMKTVFVRLPQTTLTLERLLISEYAVVDQTTLTHEGFLISEYTVVWGPRQYHVFFSLFGLRTEKSNNFNQTFLVFPRVCRH